MIAITRWLGGSALLTILISCTSLDQPASRQEADARQAFNDSLDKVTTPLPAVTFSGNAWLAGAPIKLAPPALPILHQNVVYHANKPVPLSDIASWITQTTGLVIDIAELQTTSSSSGSAGGAPGASGTTAASPSGSGSQGGASLANLQLNFDGSLLSLLDVLANKVNAWWKTEDGRIRFYRQETKTFYITAVPRKYSGSSTIDASSKNISAGDSTTGSSGGKAEGGNSNVSNYAVDLWTELATTAKAVSAGAQIAINQASGSITVTGTPAQVRRVEDWAKDLANQLSQQVAITVQVFQVKLSNENNYNWDSSIIFSAAATAATSGVVSGFSGPPIPNIVSGKIPAALTIGSNKGNFKGSGMALQALSTLGSVIQTINQTVITLNGQPVPIQIANNQGYLAASKTTATVNVGVSTTLEPGSITTGFTAMFLPRIVNGKVILGMTITHSTNNGFGEITSNGSTIQLPNIDSNVFQQSVSLTPGDELMLTGLQRDDNSLNKSGVGNPDNFWLGGGIGNNTSRQLVAIVVTARVL